MKEALECLNDVIVDWDTYISLLEFCIKIKSFSEEKLVHTHMGLNGIEPNGMLETNIIAMYAKCGSIEDARLKFEKITEWIRPSWVAMVAGFANHGDYEEALNLYCEMQETGMQYDSFVFPCVMKACASLGNL